MPFPENLQIILLSISIAVGFSVVACLFAIFVSTHLENQRLESMALWCKDQNGVLIRASFLFETSQSTPEESLPIDTTQQEEVIREEKISIRDYENDDGIEEEEEEVVESITRPKQVRLKDESYTLEWQIEQLQGLGLDFSQTLSYPPPVIIRIDDLDSSCTGSTLIIGESEEEEEEEDNQSIYSTSSSESSLTSSDEGNINNVGKDIEEIEINWVGKPGNEIFLPNSFENCYLFGFNGGRESAIIVTAN